MIKLFKQTQTIFYFLLIFFVVIGVLINSVFIVTGETVAWTDWIPSSEEPNEYYEKTDTRTEYRYRTKTSTTSYSTSLSGYTQDGYVLKTDSSGYFDYVSSFPSGFDTNNSLYLQYNKTPISASEDATQKTTVSTSTIGYIYWHWCRGDHAGAINRYIEGSYTQNANGTFHTFHAAFRSSALGNPKYSDGYCYQWANPGTCDSTYWWFGGDKYSTDQTTVYRCSYTKYKKLYNYYKWSNWSGWSTEKVTKSDSIEVETRKTSKYRIEKKNSDEKKYSVILNTNNVWSDGKIYAYVWNSTTKNKLVEWPGTEMNQENGVYKIEVPTTFDNIVFYNGVYQTLDLPISQSTNYTILSSRKDNTQGFSCNEVFEEKIKDLTEETLPNESYLVDLRNLKKQIIKAKSYTKTYGQSSFLLNVKTTGNGKLKYKTNNKKVVTVSSSGEVTIKGCGKAIITINALATSKYKFATKKITITVKPGKVKLKSKEQYKNHGKYYLKQYFYKQKNCDAYEWQLSPKKGFPIEFLRTKYLNKSKKYIYQTAAYKGRKYYIRIRAYKKISGKRYYGKWSDIIVFKT